MAERMIGFTVMRKACRLVLFIASSGIVGACQDSSVPEQYAPEASFRLSVFRADQCGASLIYDPRGSTDLDDGAEALTVRWDYDADGTWDTDFMAPDPISYDPGGFITSAWAGACEVRDPAGNTSVAHARLENPNDLPSVPDLMLDLRGFPDTVVVGETAIYVYDKRCWAPEPLTYIERHTLNGETTREFETTSGPQLRCDNIVSVVFFSIDSPGEYLCEIMLDADNEIAEEDELNNHALKHFTVIMVPSN